MIGATPQIKQRNLLQRIVNRMCEIKRIQSNENPNIFDAQIVDILQRGIANDKAMHRTLRARQPTETTRL